MARCGDRQAGYLRVESGHTACADVSFSGFSPKRNLERNLERGRRPHIYSVGVLAVFALAVFFSPPRASAGWLPDYGYRMQLTVGSSAVDSTLTNFPLLVSTEGTSATNVLRHVDSGGHVEHTNGWDIVFTDAGSTIQYDHEIEAYDKDTGELVAWVRVPELSADADTSLWLYYGRAGVSASPENVTNVWDANYVLVMHMNETPDVDANAEDSTSFANDGTWDPKLTVADQQSGRVGGSIHFGDYTNEWIGLPNGGELNDIDQITISAWIRPLGKIGGGISTRCIYNKYDWFDVNYNSPNERLGYFSRWTTYGDWDTALGTITTGVWQHVAMQYDDVGFGYSPSFYIDGQTSTKSGTQPTGTHQSDAAYAPSIGGDKQQGRWAFHGRIDEFRLSDIFRSPNWLAACHSNQVSPSTFAPLGAEQIGADGWRGGYAHRMPIVIEDTAVSSTLTDFPVLIDTAGTPAANVLKHADSGGHVRNTNGWDLLFTAADGTNALSHELEAYGPGTGELVAWVRVPTLSSSSDTKLWLYYGRAGVSASPENATNVWDSHYMAVWHFREDPTGSGRPLLDSTLHTNHLETLGSVDSSDHYANGVAGYGIELDAAQSDRLLAQDSPSLDLTGQLTVSGWQNIKNTDESEWMRLVSKKNVWDEAAGIQFAQQPSDDRFYLVSSGSTLLQVLDEDVPSDAWSHFAFTISNTTGRIYMEGSQQASGTLDALATNNRDFTVGSQAGTPNKLFDGRFDELRVSDVERSPDWIAAGQSNQAHAATFAPLGAEQTAGLVIADTSVEEGDSGTADAVFTVSIWPTNDLDVTVYYTTSNNTATTADNDYNATSGSFTIPAGVVSTTLTVTVNGDTIGEFDESFFVNVTSVVNEIICDGQALGMILNDDMGWQAGYGCRVPITISSNAVAAPLTNFPVLVNTRDTDTADDLRHVGFGGDVWNTNGWDIIFADEYGMNRYDHELELYEKETGVLAAWVRVPLLRHDTNTVLYMYYGNPNVSVSPEHGTNVWDEHFMGVWHLAEDPTSSPMRDATRWANHGNVSNMVGGCQIVATNSQCGRGIQFPGTNSWVQVPVWAGNSLDIAGKRLTLEAWAMTHEDNWWEKGLMVKGSNYNHEWYMLGVSVRDDTDGGHARMNYGAFGTGGGVRWNDVGLWPQDAWVYETYRYDGYAGKARLCINNAEVGQSNYTANIHSTGNNDLFYIGQRLPGDVYSGSSGNFAGAIDELRVSDIARSTNWLAACHANQNDPAGFAMLGAEQVSGLTIADLALFEGDSGTTDFTFTVAIGQPNPEDVTFWYVTSDGTARTEDSDYTATSGSLTIPAGNMSTTLTVSVSGDVFYEPDDIFYVDITNAVNEWIRDGQATGTIRDDDTGWPSGYRYRKPIIVSSNAVSSTLTNFPLLVNSKYTAAANELKHTSSGGHVEHTSGWDVFFAADDGTNQLDHEMDGYVGSSGELVAWVRVPELSSEEDTLLWMYYGRAGVGVSPEHGTNVWDDDYVGVWHLDDYRYDPAPQMEDSTAYTNDGTCNYNVYSPVAGRVYKAAEFDGYGDNINCGSATEIDDLAKITLSGWINPDSASGGRRIFWKYGADAGWELRKYGSNLEYLRYRPVVVDAKWYSSGGLSVPGWHHVALSYDNGSAANDPVMRIDGESVTVNESTPPSGATIEDAAGNFLISQNSALAFDGEIDEVRFSKVLRPAAWIAACYSNQAYAGTFAPLGAEESQPSLSVGNVAVIEGDTGSKQAVFPITLDKPHTQSITFWYKTTDNTATTADNDYDSESGSIVLAAGATSTNVAVTVNGDESYESDETFWLDVTNIVNSALADGRGTGTIGDDDAGGWGYGYQYRMPVLVPSNAVSATLTNFPLLVVSTGTDATNELKHTSHGGHVQHTNGWDILFTSADGTTQLSHETEGYEKDSGTYVGWVRIPLLSADSETLIWLWYGKSGVTESPENGTNVWDDDYMGVWHLHQDTEIPPPEMTDSTSYTNDGDETGPIDGFQAGAIYHCLEFHGSNEIVECGSASEIDDLDKITVSAWFRRYDNDWQRLVYKGAWRFHYQTTGRLRFQRVWTGTDGVWFSSGASGPIDYDWHHVAVSYDNGSTGNQPSFYINGVLQSGYVVTGPPSGSPESDSSYLLSFSHTDPFQSINGRLDEVRLSKEIRSGAWIAACHSNQYSPEVFAPLGAPESRPAVSISDVLVAEGDTGTTNANFTVTLSYASTTNVVVYYTTADGTAEAGTDYVAKSGSLTILPGNTVTSITVAVYGDEQIEGSSENFYVNLTNVVHAAVGDAQGKCTISDEDDVPAVSITDAGLVEGNSGSTDVQFDITLSATAQVPVTVYYMTSNGTATVADEDYEPVDSWLSGYKYRRALTISSNALGASLTDFPLLVNGSGTALTNDLKWVGVGGLVENTNGWDIVFSTADHTTLLSHDIEHYAPYAGAYVAWVRVPSLPHDRNTTLYMYFGNTSISSSTENGTNVWDAGYEAVYHLGEMSGNLHHDATRHGYDGTNGTGGTAPAPTANGKIANAQVWAQPDGDYVVLPTGTAMNSLTGTVSLWCRSTHDFSAHGMLWYGSPVLTGDGLGWHAEMHVNFQTAEGLSARCHSNSVLTAAGPYTGAWHYVTYSWSSGANEAKLYVDALQVDSVSHGSVSYKCDAAHYLGRPGLATRYYDGYLDEVRLSTAVRGPNWIAACYSNQVSPATFVTFGERDAPWVAGYGYRRRLTIPAGAVSSTLTNFPLLITTAGSDATNEFKHIGNGGHVRHAQGWDVIVTSESGEFTADHEIEHYDPATGELVLWLQTGMLRPDLETRGWLYYGKQGVTVSPENTTNVWDAHYRGVWHLAEDPNSSQILDSTAYANHGNVSNAVPGYAIAGTNSLLGLGLKWPNTNSWVQVPVSAASSLNLTGDRCTLEAWAIVHSYESPYYGEALLVKGSNYNAESYMLGLSTGAEPDVGHARVWNTSDIRMRWDTGTWAQDVWGYEAMTYNGTLGRLYINNVLVATSNFTGNIRSYGDDDLFYMGRRIGDQPGTDGYHFGGGIDELRVSDIARSPAWIAACHSNTLSPHTFGVLGPEQGQGFGQAAGVVVIPAGAIATNLFITVYGDTRLENHETFYVEIVDAVNATIGDGLALCTITNDDSQPYLTVTDVSVGEGDAGTTNAVFTVMLSAESGEPVQVEVATTNGTASAGTDYLGTNTTLTIPAGVTNTAFSVVVYGDTIDEGDWERFYLNLTNATGATISDNQGTCTVNDDDALPSVWIGNISVYEGDSGTTTNAQLAVWLSHASGSNVWFGYESTDNSAVAPGDYQSTNGLFVFSPGTTNGIITVTVNGDDSNEGTSESFWIDLITPPTNAAYADARGECIILDDDGTPYLSIDDIGLYEGNSGETEATFTVSLDGTTASEVSFNFYTTNGSALAGPDYVATNGAGTITAGTLSTTVVVRVTGETIYEQDETFELMITNVANALLADGLGVCTVTNDDAQPALSIDDVGQLEGHTGTNGFVFTVSMTNESYQNVTFYYTFSNGTATVADNDYEAYAGSLFINAGELQTQLTVNVFGDVKLEQDETFYVDITNVVNGGLTDGQGLGTITNDDSEPILSIGDAGGYEGDSGTTGYVFTVSVTNPTFEAITFWYTTSNGTATVGDGDYVSADGSVSIEPGSVSTTLTVLVNGDISYETDEIFYVDITNVMNASLSGDWRGTGTITNDDPELYVSIADTSVEEGDSGTTNATFTVTLTDEYDSGDVFAYWITSNGSAYAGSDYIGTNGYLVFTTSETNKTLEVEVYGDTDYEGVSEQFFVLITNVSVGLIADGLGECSIMDDDMAWWLQGYRYRVPITVPKGAVQSDLTNFPLLVASEGTILTNWLKHADSGGDVQHFEGWDIAFADWTATNQLDHENELYVTNSGEYVAWVRVPELSAESGTRLWLYYGRHGVSASPEHVTEVWDDDHVLVQHLQETSGTHEDSTAYGNDGNASGGVLQDAPGMIDGGDWFDGVNDTVSMPDGDSLDLTNYTVAIWLNVVSNLAQGVQVVTKEADGESPAVDINFRLGLYSDRKPFLAFEDSASANYIAKGTVALATGDWHHVVATYDQAALKLYIAGQENVSSNFSVAPNLNVQPVQLADDDGAGEDWFPGFLDEVRISRIARSASWIAACHSNQAAPTTFAPLGPRQELPLVWVELDGSPFSEASGVATVEVSLAFEPKYDVIVGFHTSGTAQDGPDYTKSATAVTFSGTETNKLLTLTGEQDTVDEATETVIVKLTNGLNAVIWTNNQEITAEILDDDPVPKITVSDVGTLVEGDSGTTNAVFWVSLNRQSVSNVLVYFTTSNGTAEAGTDYVATNGVITIAPGSTSKSITVKVNGDTDDEDLAEVFHLDLTNAVNGAITDSRGQCTITDDDNEPLLSVADTGVMEGNSGTTNVLVTVSVDGTSGSDITFWYTTANGSANAGDYQATNGIGTITAGNLSTTVTVDVYGELVHEWDQYFYLDVTNAQNAGVIDYRGKCTITNDDTAPEFWITDVSVDEGGLGTTTNANFGIGLSHASDWAVTYYYMTTNGTARVVDGDYDSAASSGQLTGGNTNATLTIVVNGDGLVELDEDFWVHITNVVNATLADGQAQCTILDDDPASHISIADVGLAEGPEGTSTNALFDVTITNFSAQDVVVYWVSSNGTAELGVDYTPESGAGTIPAGTLTGQVRMTVYGDSMWEPDETFYVSLTGVLGNATLDGGDSNALCTITNDDVYPTLYVADTSVEEGGTGATANAYMTVWLSNPGYSNVTFYGVTSNGTAEAGIDYESTNYTVTIDAGVTSATLVVKVTGDFEVEPDETFYFDATNVLNATVGDPRGMCTITNDDGPPVVTDPGAPFATITASNAMLGARVLSEGSEPVTSRGTVWDTSPDPTTNSLVAGGTGIGLFSHTRTGLVAATHYYYRGWASNAIGLAYSTNGQFYTEPDGGAYGVTLSSLTDTSVDIQWELNAGVGDGRVVVLRAGDEPTPPGPVDGTDYEEDSNFGLAPALADGARVVYNGAGTSAAVTGLPSGSNLWIAIYEYAGAGPLINYRSQTYPLTNIYVPASVSIFDTSVVEGDSGTVNATFTVSLSQPSVSNVTVYYTTADSDATAAEGDYAAKTDSFTLPAGNSSTTLTVLVNGDTAPEPEERFFVSITNVEAGAMGDELAQCMIEDDDTEWRWGFGCRRPIRIKAGAVNAELTNFPLLVSTAGTTVAPSLKHEGGGGKVVHSNGWDILFTAADGTNRLDHENDGYSPESGDYNAWVRVPTISPAADTILWMYYRMGGLDKSSENATNVWDDGYLGVWHLSEDEGLAAPQMLDSTVNTNDGTVVNDVDGAVDGKIFRAADFGGSSDYIDCASSGWNINPTNVTIHAWVKRNNDDYSVIAGKGNKFSLSYYADGRGRWWRYRTGISPAWNEASGSILGGAWRHVVLSYEDGSSSATLYVNGKSRTMNMVGGPPSGDVICDAMEFTISVDDPDQAVRGKIDEVRLSKVVRTPAWMAACYSNQAQAAAFALIGQEYCQPGLALSGPLVVPEGDSNHDVMFTLSLAGPLDVDVSTAYATANGTAQGGSDFGNASGRLSIPAGQTQTQITVQVYGDTNPEFGGGGWENFFLDLSSPTNAWNAVWRLQCLIADDDGSQTQPTVNNNGGPTEVSASQARLHGKVLSGAPEPLAYICWGECDEGTNVTAWQHVIPFGVQNDAFSNTVSMANDGKTYFYRAFAHSTGGEAWAPSAHAWSALEVQTNVWYMLSVPVRWDNAASNNLSATLGEQLATGLTGGTGPINSDSMWIWRDGSWVQAWLDDSSGTWKTNADAADLVIQSGEGFWVKRLTGTAPSSMLLHGWAQTNAVEISMVKDQWTMFGWPYSPRGEAEGASPGWGFPAQGATASYSYRYADMITGNYDGRTFTIFLHNDGHWHDKGSVDPTDVRLEPGKSYYYFRRGTGNLNYTAPYGE